MASSSGEVRKRKGLGRGSSVDSAQEQSSESERSGDDTTSKDDEPKIEKKKMESGSYWLTRITFIRALGFVYCK